ncbi:MAG TPA: tRNA uridine-5-carboxymethylaminomethyl(34) synthesis GTPase MnmE [Methylomirabilota bacterium]
MTVASASTIAAIATPPGEGAIGVIRVSGRDAIPIVGPLVRHAKLPLPEFRPRVAHRVGLVDPRTGGTIDEAVCVVFRGPHSYTGEDVVELSCHGSPALLALVVARLVEGGARLAEPGEFSRRAYLNGRLDLAQAEAVALLIRARSERAVTLAARTLGGGLSRPLHALREGLLDLIASLEVTLDFAEEGYGIDAGAALKALTPLRTEAAHWLEVAHSGRLVHDGVTVCIVGAPNAGKSSLFNALLGRERAIVSAIPGTTRDVVEGRLELAGVGVRLLDTAGIREPRDVLEAEGIRRAQAAASESDLLLVVLDGTTPPDLAIIDRTADRRRVLVVTKSDLPGHPRTHDIADALRASSVTGEGVEAITARLCDEIGRLTLEADDESGIVASLRQMELLARLRDALATAEAALARAPIEVALLDLGVGLGAVSEILGTAVSDSVLDRIFSVFCIGK